MHFIVDLFWVSLCSFPSLTILYCLYKEAFITNHLSKMLGYHWGVPVSRALQDLEVEWMVISK